MEKNLEKNLISTKQLSQAEAEKFQQLESTSQAIKELRSDLAQDVKKIRKILDFKTRRDLRSGDENTKKDSYSVLATDFLNLIEKKQKQITEKFSLSATDDDAFLQQLDQTLQSYQTNTEDLDSCLNKMNMLDDVTDILKKYAQLKSLISGGLKQQEVEGYMKFISREKVDAVREIKLYNDRLDALEKMIADITKHPSDQKSSVRDLMRLHKTRNRVFQLYQDRIKSSPDIFLTLTTNRLREAQETISRGGAIVETPYVRSVEKRIVGVLQDNRPVFIHGELGSGKTEVAKHLSRKNLSSNHIARWEKSNPRPTPPAILLEKPELDEQTQASMLIHKDENLQKIAKQHQEVLDAYKIKISLPENQKIVADYESSLREWEAKRAMQAEPLVISGHRHLEIEQILGGISLKRKESPSPEAQIAIINTAINEYLGKRQSMGNIDQKTIAEIKSYYLDKNDLGALENLQQKFEEKINKFYLANKDADNIQSELADLRKSYLDSFKNPVETKVYLASFYRAMREGRPVIIDELNAIPHHVLIMLNDLLTVRPGQTIKPMINDAEEFVVQPGFCVIATGNWRPEESDRYVGRQAIDAAFLSRFGLVHYDYLPNEVPAKADTKNDQPNSSQDESSSPEYIESQRQAREQNELLFMMMTRLIDKDLTVTWPAGSKQKLLRLARLARVFQDIFSGKEFDTQIFNTEGIKGMSGNRKLQEVLKENVLSLRHLIPILSKWKNEGFTRSLDDYLYLDYVDRSSARPDEQKFIYKTLRELGDFFKEKKTLPDGKEEYIYPEETKNLSGFNIQKHMYRFDAKTNRAQPLEINGSKMEKMNTRQIVEMLFGKIPDRQYFDTNLLSEDMEKIEEVVEILDEIFDTYEKNVYGIFPIDKVDIYNENIVPEIVEFQEVLNKRLAQLEKYITKKDNNSISKEIQNIALIIAQKMFDAKVIDSILFDRYKANLVSGVLNNIDDATTSQIVSRLMSIGGNK